MSFIPRTSFSEESAPFFPARRWFLHTWSATHGIIMSQPIWWMRTICPPERSAPPFRFPSEARWTVLSRKRETWKSSMRSMRRTSGAGDFPRICRTTVGNWRGKRWNPSAISSWKKAEYTISANKASSIFYCNRWGFYLCWWKFESKSWIWLCTSRKYVFFQANRYCWYRKRFWFLYQSSACTICFFR